MTEPISGRAQLLLAQLERVRAGATPPEPRYLCRCGDTWRADKNGHRRRIPVGMVEVKVEGRGFWRRCQKCAKQPAAKAVPADEERFS